ncbi:leucine rich repeat protein [Mucor ambiguus]|uniref:Leucine rich repeat protein n=1 Tax=Mucor ambiguus TaxID=91626 RepID=A0A0C9MP26_9FUNG|nr:leucine rich repeat protein [Mucor ambiguus]
MGQTISHQNSKSKFGSTIFGYTTSTKITTPPVYIKKTDQDIREDNVLFKPFLYGLQSTGSNHSVDSVTTENQGRTDSGFLLTGKDSQLWKDLMYVDQTYYPDEQQESTHESEIEDLLIGDTLIFKDISCMSQNNMQDIDLTRRGLGFISPNIGLLSMMRKLDLSHNKLKEIPEAIGHLQQLENLSVAHNQITFIPDTICHLVHLTDFNLSHNQLEQVTPFISHLKGLQTLQLGHNQLQELTVSVEHLCNLTLLDLSYNLIHVLPAEIIQLPFLRRLRLDGCPFTNSLDQPFELAHNPPSLLETCARYIIKNEHQILSSVTNNKKQMNNKAMAVETLKLLITDPLYQYLSTFSACSHCQGPYFESYVKRGRWVERNDVWVPLEYRLCSAHWSDESDRVYAMFSASQPLTSVSSKKGPVAITTSFMKTKPRLPILEIPVIEQVSSAAVTAVIGSKSTPSALTTTRRSCFNNQRRLSSTNAPPIMMQSTTTQQVQINEEEESISIPNETTSSSSSATAANAPSSSVKRWRFKVRNNSSLFLKNHRLY